MNKHIIYNQTVIIDTIKLLLYKEYPKVLERINFEDNNVFLEPLLFAYFNGKKDNIFPSSILEEILQGYFIKKQPIKIKHSYNKNKIAYIPKVGYFKKKAYSF